MCDYSLEHAMSRPAVQGERLVTKDFGRGTIGFSAEGDDGITSFNASDCTAVAVCVLPGTELAFDAPVKPRWALMPSDDVKDRYPATARFTQVNKDDAHMHHDALLFPGMDEPVSLSAIKSCQYATVLQVPVDPQAKRVSDEDEGKEERSPKRLEPVV